MVQDHQIDIRIALLSGEGSVAGRRHFWRKSSEVAFDVREVILEGLQGCQSRTVVEDAYLLLSLG